MDNYDNELSDVDTSLLRSPNNYSDPNDSSLYDNAREDFNYIPTSSDEVSSLPKKRSSVDPRNVLDLLQDAADSQGVSVSLVMSNTAVAMANKFGLEPSSMEWFIAGISYSNNQMMMEKMAQSIKDLQVEIRSLQGTSGVLKSNTEEFMSKMRANKNEITSEITKTKDTVIHALQSMRYPSSMPEVSVVTAKIDVPKASTSQAAPPQIINEALLAKALSEPVKTKSPEEILVRRYEDFLLSIGFEIEDIAKIPSEYLEIIIDRAWLDLDLDEESNQTMVDLTDSVLVNMMECGLSL
nr:TPA_asm: P [Tolmeia alphacytorhabdovirus 1]